MLRGHHFFCATLVLCAPAWAEPASLQRAEDLIQRGEWGKALPLLEGSDRTSRVLRADALLRARLTSQADPLLETLRQETASDPSLTDFRYLEVLGRWARATGQTELAVKALTEARKMAKTPDQSLEALDRLLIISVGRKEWEKARSILQETQSLLPKLGSPRTLADHLNVLSNYQEGQGRRTEALASLASARVIYRSLEMPIRAADTTLMMAPLSGDDGDSAAEWDGVDAALGEYLALKDPDGVYDSLVRLTRLSYPLPDHKQLTAQRFKEALEALPPGPQRTMVEIESLSFRYKSMGETEAARKGLLALLARPDVRGESRLLALYHAAEMAGLGGQEEATKYWTEALTLATPRHTGERRAFLSPGPLRLALASLQRDQGDYEASLASLRTAVAEQSSADWRVWRIFSGRYQALLSLLPLHDVTRAKAELRSALEDLEGLESLEGKTNFLTVILAPLSLNRALEEDQLDPAERALGPYDAISRELLEEMLVRGDVYLRLYDRQVQELRESGDLAELGPALYWRSFFLEAAGRTAEARSGLHEAIRLTTENKQTLEGLIAQLLLARLENLDGRPQAALAALRQAAEAAEPLPPATARFHRILLASYQRRQGHLEPAIESYERAARAEPSKAWTAHYGRALTLRELGRSADALSAVELALAAPEVERRPSSRALMKALRGELLLKAGRTSEGLSELERALPSLLASAPPDLVSRTALVSAEALRSQERQEQAYAVARQALDGLLARQTTDSTEPLFELVATLALETGRREEALHYLTLSRSAELVGSVKLAQIEHQDPHTSDLLKSLEQLKERLEGLQAESDRGREEAKTGISRALAETREQFFAKLDELKRLEPDFEALVQLSGSDLSALQAALDDETVLLQYFPAETSLYVFAVGKQRFGIHRVAVGRAELERTIGHYVRLIREPDSDVKTLAEASHTLHALTIEPVLDELEGKRHLLIAPSGPLWNVRFEELRDGRGQSLDERWPVAVLTSADLVASLRPESQGARSTSNAVLLGAPDTEDLPGARAELQAVEKLTTRAVTLLGEQATSGALKQNAPRAKLLHIASHSGLGKIPGESYISLADGPFSLEKVYGLSLPSGALVVLSSCRSALGEAQPGREVTSLASAFKIAGASTVIASHWEVDDEVTRELFESFYRHLAQGRPRGEALRLARRETARQHPHPYYWAAFSLYGNPR